MIFIIELFILLAVGQSLSCVWLFATPVGCAPRLFCPWDFPGEYWSGLPFPSPYLYFIRHFYHLIWIIWACLVVQMVKNPPVMQETWVQSLGQEDPLEKEMATHSSILAWRIPWTARILAGYSPWGCRELDMSECLSTFVESCNWGGQDRLSGAEVNFKFYKNLIKQVSDLNLQLTLNFSI